jgi:gamma-glutamylcyclotransferase (GGCT)/AIG2-like uncharacterized protein YtfP
VLYFAYGMNTNSKAMSSTSKRLGPAELPNYSWEMIRFANVFEDKEGSCTGILWDIDADELARLDLREGYPTFYDRITTEVIHNGDKKSAIVYTMTDSYRKDLSNYRPTKQYIECVAEGFAEDGIRLFY